MTIFDTVLREIEELLAGGPQGQPPPRKILVEQNPGPGQITTSQYTVTLAQHIAQVVQDRVAEAPSGSDGKSHPDIVNAAQAGLTILFKAIALAQGDLETGLANGLYGDLQDWPADAKALIDDTLNWMSIPEQARALVGDAQPTPKVRQRGRSVFVTTAAVTKLPGEAITIADIYDGDVDDFKDPDDVLSLVTASTCSQAFPVSPEGSNWLIGAHAHVQVQIEYWTRYGKRNTVCLERAYSQDGLVHKLRNAPNNSAAYRMNAAMGLACRLKNPSSKTRLTYKRPDIADLTTGDFYEIKPRGSAQLGSRQLQAYYIMPYNVFRQSKEKEPTAVEGEVARIRPGSFLTVDTSGEQKSWVRVEYSAPCPGLILYTVQKIDEDVYESFKRIARLVAAADSIVEAIRKKLLQGKLSGPSANDNQEGEKEEEERRVARISLQIYMVILMQIAPLVVGLKLGRDRVQATLPVIAAAILAFLAGLAKAPMLPV